MTKTARVYKIELLIRTRGSVTFRELLEELEVSPATLKRDLEYLRDQLGAPTAASATSCPGCGSASANCTRCSLRTSC
jgi:predicted DNA-binding transcriptional regulator YafY